MLKRRHFLTFCLCFKQFVVFLATAVAETCMTLAIVCNSDGAIDAVGAVAAITGAVVLLLFL